MSIEYSDGHEIEAQIRQLIQSSPRVDSQFNIAREHYHQWPIRYHLCSERANLIRHLNFEGLEVLELGAGMGAVSRHLAENVKRLSVVEGTESRCAALKQRLRDLDNWNAQVTNIETFSSAKRYDAVFVIGVLEYADLFFKGKKEQSAFLSFLEKVYSHLKEGGVLVLAIENKLGLKYWSGAPEDHLSQLYAGICNYPPTRSPRTFSRKELLDLFRLVGFQNTVEYFPFPDYKTPTTVLSKECIESYPKLAMQMAINQACFDHPGKRVTVFPDWLALESLSKAGLLKDFANSFLFLTVKGNSTSLLEHLHARQKKKREIAWHYSLNRTIPTKTTVVQSGKTVSTRKGALFSEGLRQEKLSEVSWNSLTIEPVAEGKSLTGIFIGQLYFQGWETFQNTFNQFLQQAFEKFHASADQMEGQALDALFHNATKHSEKDLQFFDLEFCWQCPIQKTWYIFRNVYALRNLLPVLRGKAPHKNLKEIYEGFCSNHKLSPDFSKDMERDAYFLKLVTEETSEERLLDVAYAHFTQAIDTPEFQTHVDTELSLRRRANRISKLLPLRAWHRVKHHHSQLRSALKAIRELSSQRTK